jgi:hypothetical protein
MGRGRGGPALYASLLHVEEDRAAASNNNKANTNMPPLE